MTSIRELPFEEWDKLAELPFAANGLPAGDVKVMVAEDENGDIVGVWSAGLIVCLEGLWVAEEHRKKNTLWKLFYGMMAALRSEQIDIVYSLVQTDEMLKLAEHGGFKEIPGHFIVKSLDEAV